MIGNAVELKTRYLIFFLRGLYRVMWLLLLKTKENTTIQNEISLSAEQMKCILFCGLMYCIREKMTKRNPIF